MTNPFKFRGRVVRCASSLLLLCMTSINLYAQQPMAITLKGVAEVPAVKTSTTGTGQIMVLPDQTVSGSIKTSGLVSTAAHIHEAASGQSGPPIITLTKDRQRQLCRPGRCQADRYPVRQLQGRSYLRQCA